MILCRQDVPASFPRNAAEARQILGERNGYRQKLLEEAKNVGPEPKQYANYRERGYVKQTFSLFLLYINTWDLVLCIKLSNVALSGTGDLTHSREVVYSQAP